ncbi:hypothetical protein ACB098_05G057300 [Castanea mollissima]
MLSSAVSVSFNKNQQKKEEEILPSSRSVHFVSATPYTQASKSLDVPKDYLAVYVGESEKKRFVIPISFLNQPTFQQLLNKAKEGLLYVIFFVHIVMNFSEGL